MPPTYVVLIGDAEFIPTHYVTVHPYHGTHTGTDLYYATIDGNDYFPDISIGRLSVDTLAQANKRVNDIISYEKAVVTDSNFYKKAALAAYFQHAGGGYDERRFAQTAEDVAIFLSDPRYLGKYSVDRIYYTQSDVIPLYWSQYWFGGGPAGNPGDTIPSYLKKPGFAWNGDKTAIDTAINDGRFLLIHRDHGGPSDWGAPFYHTSYVQALTNGNKLPVVWSINCQTGWFDNETDEETYTTPDAVHFSEAWERNTNGGAVGVIGATRVSYSGFNDYYLWGWADAIWPDFEKSYNPSGMPFDKPVYEMGPVLNYGKYYMALRYGDSIYTKTEFEIFHWFGDPTMQIWTDVPQTLSVSQSSMLPIGATSLDVTVNEPDTDTLICVSKSGAILDRKLAMSGTTTLSWSVPLAQGETIDVTVTKHNFKPYVSNIRVMQFGHLPDTGQTKCYDNSGEIPCPTPGHDFYGQDGSYIISPPSYTKLDANGNPLTDSAPSWSMVKDSVTGLIWEAKQAKDGVANYSNPHDADNAYTWYNSDPATNGGNPGTPGNRTDTEDFINALNSAKFGGFSDWRLPTVKELDSITNVGNYNPSINRNFFPDAFSTPYWTSTLVANDSYYISWYVDFLHGDSYLASKNNVFHVRAVRGIGNSSSNSLIDNKNGTVTDINTGLMWQKIYNSTRLNWQDANAYCENLSLGAYNDWRLPNIREIFSLVDIGRGQPSINTAYFPNTPWYGEYDSTYFMSSSTVSDNGSLVWTIEFSSGATYNQSLHLSKTVPHYVRCVRSVNDPVCSYIISPSSQSFTSSAGTGSVNVTAASGCAWTATNNDPSWITITSGASGNGNGTVVYSVFANPNTTPRTGTITIAGQSFTVTQAGIPCSYSIAPSSQPFTPFAGTGSVSITAQTGCPWTAISNNIGWLTITSGNSGSGSGTVNFSVAQNTSVNSRTGTMTIAGQTFTVTQAGCTYSISASSQSFVSTGGSGSINVTSQCAWTATSNASWISVTSGNSGNGNGTVSYSVLANSDIRSRTGSISVAGQTFTVTQGHNSSSVVVPDDYSTIQAAIDASSDGMAVYVADGTYTGIGNKDLDFKGKKITLRSENGAAATIIDCENSGRGFYFHSGETSASVVSGFTIKNGNVMNTGGGIHCENSSPTISNCVITNCQVTVDSSVDNIGGAGIYAKGSNITLTDTNIVNCSANGSISNGGGGGLYFINLDWSLSKSIKPTLTNCTISNNKTYSYGGGIYSYGCSLALNKCNITDNLASTNGGVYITGSGADIVITDTNILRNTAGGIGFGYYINVTMERCKISENISGNRGGGIMFYAVGSSSMTLKNCVVSRNTATAGGGGVLCISDPYSSNQALFTVINSTIADNNGTTQGGGLYSPSWSPPSTVCIPNFINSIVWGNTPDQIYLWDTNASPVVSYSNIQGGGYAGAGNINADPLFVGNGDYHLTASSPSVNTGTSGANIPTTDIEGKSRPQGSGYDMGAYER